MLSNARSLRKSQTEAEKTLWHHLRSKQLEGLKFRRQHPIDHYIVDFVCLERRIIIEVDGGQHAPEKEKDKIREDFLTGQGFTILRFWNHEVLVSMEAVLTVIRERCLTLPRPLPSREGREKGSLPPREGSQEWITPAKGGEREGIPPAEGGESRMDHSRQGRGVKNGSLPSREG
ncbi:MAG: endonuclease domain-containing protein [Syntrophales bacterium]